MSNKVLPSKEVEPPEVVPQKTISETVQKKLLDIVRRQTDYTDDIIITKLSEHNNNVVTIIREFMNNGQKPRPPQKEPPKTTNQMVFSEIRKLMDDASEAYRKKKELASNEK